MLGAGDVQLYEVKAFEEDFHSWFVGQTVQRGVSHFLSASEFDRLVFHQRSAGKE